MNLLDRSTAPGLAPHGIAGLLIACVLAGLGWTTAQRGAPQDDRAASRAATGATTLLIVRHADRDGDRDALTSDGDARARELVHVASRAGVSAIYCTKTERSRRTAAPLAAALHLVPVELDPKDTPGLTKRLLTEHGGETALVVGHSDTIPAIIAGAGGPKIKNIGHDDFDDLFVMTLGSQPGVEAKLVHLQYGAPTP